MMFCILFLAIRFAFAIEFIQPDVGNNQSIYKSESYAISIQKSDVFNKIAARARNLMFNVEKNNNKFYIYLGNKKDMFRVERDAPNVITVYFNSSAKKNGGNRDFYIRVNSGNNPITKFNLDDVYKGGKLGTKAILTVTLKRINAINPNNE